jgi:hypothetical protein
MDELAAVRRLQAPILTVRRCWLVWLQISFKTFVLLQTNPPRNDAMRTLTSHQKQAHEPHSPQSQQELLKFRTSMEKKKKATEQ